MGKVEITLKSGLVTKNPRPDRYPTSFSRALRKLRDTGLAPGKIIRLYTNIDDDYKTFGALSLNTGGSISFFPDLHKLDIFDHLTLNRDFLSKNGHLTQINPDGKRSKPFHFRASELSNDGFHIITFAMKDDDLLSDVVPELELPEIEFDNEEEILELLKESIHHDAYMLTFPDEPGFFGIQLQVLPRANRIEDVSIDTGFVEKFAGKLLPVPGILNAKSVKIDGLDGSNFSLGIRLFKINEDPSAPMAFFMAQDPEKPPRFSTLD